MKSKFPKKLLACLFKLAGIYYALYIGVWTMGIHNLYATIQELLAGNLSITMPAICKKCGCFCLFPFCSRSNLVCGRHFMQQIQGFP